MDWLKKILNDEEIENKVDAISKELPNHFIPKDKYNSAADKLKEREDELKATKKQLDDLNKQVQDLSKVTDEKEKLQESLDKIKSEYEEFQSEADKKVVNIKKRQAVERGLREANANPETIDLLIDKFSLDDLELDDKENVKEWDKHLEPIKGERKSLFGETSISGDRPPDGDDPDKKGLKQQYDEALKAGKRQEAIKIKQEAYKEGKLF